VKRIKQRSLYCSCGREQLKAGGLCGTCYSLKRQDEEYFGGLREAVLDRDGRRCRVCDAPGGRKRSLAVHHRMPGRSELNLMITLCLACHAKVTRTTALSVYWPELLRILWREQHPLAHEQLPLDFTIRRPPPQPVRLIPEQAALTDHGNGATVESAER